MAIQAHDLPLYNIHDDEDDDALDTRPAVWGKTYQWEEQTLDVCQEYAREKNIYDYIDQYQQNNLHDPEAACAILTWLYACSPGITINDISPQGHNHARRCIVLPSIGTVSMYASNVEMPNHDGTFEPFALCYCYKEAYIMVHLRDARKPMTVVDPHGYQVVSQMYRDASDTLAGAYPIQERIHRLYSTKNRMHVEHDAVDLYLSWIYWMVHHGNEQDLVRSRVCSAMMGGTSEQFTQEGLLFAVRQTALKHFFDANDGCVTPLDPFVLS